MILGSPHNIPQIGNHLHLGFWIICLVLHPVLEAVSLTNGILNATD